ncbi:NAD(P)H-dependent oxidoreductase [uncultured Fusobacterium sp.]|uniref:flavodoxin family protein n=1 Tax=uncultured Fusobacterium sp. TaxID=159267 RepID=UPI0025DB4221|nr:NAD(P)H-dependent oxidoreductase [uncultured Fusobacterium sp.]
MKNILILSSSPRKNGNSDILCEQFIKGAKESGHNTEKIYISDIKINYCKGCGVCNTILQTKKRDCCILICNSPLSYKLFFSLVLFYQKI